MTEDSVIHCDRFLYSFGAYLTGQGKLTLVSSSTIGAIKSYGDLTFDHAKVEIQAPKPVSCGTSAGTLTVIASDLDFKATDAATPAVSGFGGGFTLTGCGIAQPNPCSAVSGVLVDDSGNPAQHVTFSSALTDNLHQTAVYDLTVDGVQVTELNQDDIIDTTVLLNYLSNRAEPGKGLAYIYVYSESKGGSWTVTGIGSNTDENLVVPAWHAGQRVTAVAESAFAGQTHIRSLSLPASVKKIGSSAFSGCTALESVSLPEGLTSLGANLFRNCAALQTVSLPSILRSIPAGLFDGCSSLARVTMPSSPASIGERAFRSCAALTSVDLPSSVRSIGTNAFDGCASLTEISVPDAVRTLSNYTFRGCTALQSVTLPEEMSSIGAFAFKDCTSLSSIDLPASLRTLGSKAFAGCRKLTALHLPASLASIAVRGLIDGCDSLYTLTVASGNTRYIAQNNCLIERSSRTLALVCNGSVLTGTTATSIGVYAFYGCKGLLNITIPSGITSIATNAFYDCTNLVVVRNQSSLTINFASGTNGNVARFAKAIFDSSNRVTYSSSRYSFYGSGNMLLFDTAGAVPKLIAIPGNVNIALPAAYNGGAYEIENCVCGARVTIPSSFTQIGDNAFNGNCNITGVIIPATVTSIGENAFAGCTRLTQVTFSGTQEQWNAIAIADGNEALLGAEVAFSS